MKFSELSEYFQKLEGTASRLTMTEILAELFRKADGEEAGHICYLLQGRVVPLYEAIEFGVADKFMIRAIALAYSLTPEEVTSVFRKTGDLGSAVETLHRPSLLGTENKRLTVENVYTKLTDITGISGEGSQEQKIGLLADLLSMVDKLSARYIVRIPLGKLRLGFSDMTILDGLSWMLGGDKSLRIRLEDAYNVRPDIGFIATTVKNSGISGLSHVKAKLGVPILAALCQRLPTADEMIAKMGTVAVEPKYDGVRVQIHWKKPDGRGQMAEISSFSRNLENTTAMFSELAEIGDQIEGREVILDSEAIGFDPKTGKVLSFQETTTRKRKHNIEETRKGMPLKFYVFDILYKNGKELLQSPLSERRTILSETVKKGSILEISPQIITTRPDELREYHDEQLKKGLEGVVVKRWVSPYEPGRRGFSWVKFKEEEGKTGKLSDTVDAVVMGYYMGEGKRAGFGIGAFLVGVRDRESFVTVTKIGTGVSDEQWKQLLTQLNKLKVAGQPKEYKDVHKLLIPDVWISPRIVVEVAGDDLTRSPNHGAGYALRFPRLIRIRDDKGPRDATTVAEIKTLFEAQGTHV